MVFSHRLLRSRRRYLGRLRPTAPRPRPVAILSKTLAGADGVPTGGGPHPTTSATQILGSGALPPNADDAGLQYVTADALLADACGAAIQGTSEEANTTGRGAASTTIQVENGTIDYLNADVILAGDDGEAGPPLGVFNAANVKIDSGGWPHEGPGRGEGSGLHLRASLTTVLEVMFATMAYNSLAEHFDSSAHTFKCMAALRELRRKHKKITYAALRGRVWDLAPSGAVGVVVRFGGHGSRDSSGQHELVVMTASLKGDEVQCACSLEESCLDIQGCSWRAPVGSALEQVRSVMETSIVDLFTVLRAAVKTRSLRAGKGVLYADKTCVIRNGDTSWPFSAVRRTRGGSWVCLSCRMGDGTCDHVGSAVAAAKKDADAAGDSSDSEAEEDAGDEARLVELAGLSVAADEEACGATEAPPHLPRATEAQIPVNRFK